MNISVAIEFEQIIKELFELLDYKIDRQATNIQDNGIDIVAHNHKTTYYVEVKFYRSVKVSSGTLKALANNLAFLLKNKPGCSGLVVVNCVVPHKLMRDIVDEFGIGIWDRQLIYNLLTTRSIDLREKFEKLLLVSQQGTEATDVFKGFQLQDVERREILVPESSSEPKYKAPPFKKGKELYEKLLEIPCGKDDWKMFEERCIDILQFLFDDDLVLWKKQNRTDDNLSRFDLICRIASNNDYWKAIVSSFNSRFVLFEFKNYCNPIGQDQIYTTERYLYIKGLRSVGFMIASNGYSDQAEVAAKGALKEHGKLILLLSTKDLYEMLRLKDNNDSPNDYLADLLDNWLIALSR